MNLSHSTRARAPMVIASLVATMGVAIAQIEPVELTRRVEAALTSGTPPLEFARLELTDYQDEWREFVVAQGASWARVFMERYADPIRGIAANDPLDGLASSTALLAELAALPAPAASLPVFAVTYLAEAPRAPRPAVSILARLGEGVFRADATLAASTAALAGAEAADLAKAAIAWQADGGSGREACEALRAVLRREDRGPEALDALVAVLERTAEAGEEAAAALNTVREIILDASLPDALRARAVVSWPALCRLAPESNARLDELEEFYRSGEPRTGGLALAVLARVRPERAEGLISAALVSEGDHEVVTGLYASLYLPEMDGAAARVIEQAALEHWRKTQGSVALRVLSDSVAARESRSAWEALRQAHEEANGSELACRVLLAAFLGHAGALTPGGGPASPFAEERERWLVDVAGERFAVAGTVAERSLHMSVLMLCDHAEALRLAADHAELPLARLALSHLLRAAPSTEIREAAAARLRQIGATEAELADPGGLPRSLLAYYRGAASLAEVGRDLSSTALDGGPDGFLAFLAIWLVAGAQSLADEPAWPEEDRSRSRRLVLESGSAVTDLAFARQGDVIATGHRDGNVRIWGARTGVQLGLFRAHDDWVASVTFSPDGQDVLTAGADDRVRVFQTESGQERLELEPGVNRLYPCKALFSPVGSTIAWGSSGTLRVADLESGATLLQLDIEEHSLTSIAFSPDGARLASADGYENVHLWSASTGAEIVPRPEVHGTHVVFSPNGRYLAVWGGADPEASLWDVLEQRIARKLSTPDGRVRAAVFSPSGDVLAIACPAGHVHLLAVENGKLLETLETERREIEALAWAPAGDTLAAGLRDGSLILWHQPAKAADTIGDNGGK